MDDSQLAYSYLRMSTVAQLDGDSRRRQLDRGRKYADKHGLRLVDLPPDIGVSAFKGRNRSDGQLGMFYRAVREGSVPPGSYLLVENLDRLSRESPRKALKPFLELIDAGIRVVTLLDEQVFDAQKLDREPWSLMVSLMVMTRANEESETKSDRISEAWKQKHARAHKEIASRRCPGWLRPAWHKGADPTHFEPIPEMVDCVRRIFEMAAGGMGRLAIMKVLNGEGREAARGGRWSLTAIQHLIWNDAVLGTYTPCSGKGADRRPRGEPIPGYYPQVVDHDVVARARAAVVQRRTGASSGRKGKTYSNIFSGMIYCVCGAKMRIRDRGPKGGRRLACTSVVEGGGCHHRRSFGYAVFERAFLKHVTEIDVSGLDEVRDGELVELREGLAAVAAEEATVQRSLERLLSSIETGDRPHSVLARIREREIQLRELAAKKHDLSEAIVGATHRERDHVATIKGLRRRLSQTTDVAELYELRARLHQAIQRVVTKIIFHGTDGFAGVFVVGGFKMYLISRTGAWKAVARRPGFNFKPLKTTSHGLRRGHDQDRRSN